MLVRVRPFVFAGPSVPGPNGPAVIGSALTLLRVPRRAVIAAMAVMTLVIFPLAAFPVAAAVVVTIAMPANDHRGRRSNHDGRRRDDDRCGRADVDVDVDGVGEAGQRKAEAGEGKGDQRALPVLFRDVDIKGRRDAMKARGTVPPGGTPHRHMQCDGARRKTRGGVVTEDWWLAGAGCGHRAASFDNGGLRARMMARAPGHRLRGFDIRWRAATKRD